MIAAIERIVHLAAAVAFAALITISVYQWRADNDAASHGPPRVVVEMTAPAHRAVEPWHALRNPMLAAVAEVHATCDGIEREKAPDLARNWRGVCLEIAVRAPAYGVRPALAVSVAWHESRFNAHAIGALGEVGPLQVRPEMHCGGLDCADRIGAGLEVLARYVARHGERDGMCRYRGAALGCNSPRVALADRIDERGE